jgi:hypothetical protein
MTIATVTFFVVIKPKKKAMTTTVIAFFTIIEPKKKVTTTIVDTFFTTTEPKKKKREGAYFQAPALCCHFWLSLQAHCPGSRLKCVVLAPASSFFEL